MSYQLEINKDPAHYFFFLKNSPPGLKINKDNGTLTIKPDKSFFLSGKLKYDYDYKVNVSVQNMDDPRERVDTVFTIVFFTTEIVSSHIKPTVSNVLYIEEGDTISFRLECDNGSFPIESINFFSNIPIKNYTLVKKCDDDFTWSPTHDFIKDADSLKQRLLLLSFVGTNKFFVKDTAVVKIYIKDALDIDAAMREYNKTEQAYTKYILQLKYAFVQLDKSVKHTKNTRSTFDLATASTALGGTLLASSSTIATQNVGKVLPSIGVTLVPVKEAVAPPQNVEQNSASLVRAAIKRLEYSLNDNALIGDKDPEILKKTSKLREELKQTQIQLIDIPVDETNNMTAEQLNEYFNNPKVNSKYSYKKK